MIMAQTTEHLFLIHDGARYHTSAATQAFLAAHSDRITAEPLPSYSPDYNPIEYLWKKTKKDPLHERPKVVDSLPGYTSGMAGCGPNLASQVKLSRRLSGSTDGTIRPL